MGVDRSVLRERFQCEQHEQEAMIVVQKGYRSSFVEEQRIIERKKKVASDAHGQAYQGSRRNVECSGQATDRDGKATMVRIT